MGGQHGQAVGVDEDGQIGPEHRAQQLGGIVAGAHAGTGYPGLHPAHGSEKVSAVVSVQRLPPPAARVAAG